MRERCALTLGKYICNDSKHEVGMVWHPRKDGFRMVVTEQERPPYGYDTSAGIIFTPVPGKPGVWKEPHPTVRAIALAGDSSDHLYQEIAKANPELFRHGPPKTIYSVADYRKDIVRGVVARAPYQPLEPPTSIHRNDPRRKPIFYYTPVSPQDQSDVEYYDRVYEDEHRQFLERKRLDEACEAHVSRMHSLPPIQEALAMGLHPRLGRLSPFRDLSDDLLHSITQHT